MSSKNTVPPDEFISEQERNIEQLVQLTVLELQAESGQVIQQSMAASRRVIEPLLLDDEESTLMQAISRAGERLGHEGSLVLRSNIEALASECMVEVEGGISVRGGLYALPVQVFSREPGRFVGGAVAKDLFAKLVDCAKESGLVSEKARMGFVPYLYQAGELIGHEFGHIRQFTQTVVQYLADPDFDAYPGGFLQLADYERAQNPDFYMESFKVMHLVFGVIDEETAVPFVCMADGEIDLNATDLALAAWVNDIAETVRLLFGGEKVLTHVGHPRSFCAALREGEDNFRSSHFQVRLLEHLKTTGSNPEELSLVVTAHGEDGYLEEYRVTAHDALTGLAQFTEVYSFFPWDAFDELEDELEQHLKHAGFVRIEMPQELLPLGHRPGDSRPHNPTLH